MRILIIVGALFTLMACADKPKSGVVNGKKLFRLNCSVCHGVDGTLQANGSKDLSLSTLTKAERVFMIRKGKGAMTPFEKVLSLEEIKAVADFTMTLKSSK